jgi:hypothetical protein
MGHSHSQEADSHPLVTKSSPFPEQEISCPCSQKLVPNLSHQMKLVRTFTLYSYHLSLDFPNGHLHILDETEEINFGLKRLRVRTSDSHRHADVSRRTDKCLNKLKRENFTADTSGVPRGVVWGVQTPPPRNSEVLQSRTGLQIEWKVFSVLIPTP